MGTFLLVLICTCKVCAHPYSISWIHADLLKDKVVLSIKVTAEDLLYFHDLAMDSLFRIDQSSLKTAAESHAETINANFFILDEGKEKLTGKITGYNFHSINNINQVDVMDLAKYPLLYYMEVKLNENTELLTFNQTLAQDGIPAVSSLAITKNGTQLVNNVQISNDKGFSIGRNAISISDESGMNVMLSYIKLTDTQVSHEVTIPITLLSSFIAFEDVTPEENLTAIRTFIETNSDVKVNGQILKPTVEALNIQNGLKDIVDDNTLINFRISYSLQSLPRNITISWKSFNWQMRWFKSLIDDFGVEKEHTFSRFNPTFKTNREQLKKIE
jgi:hypothetical protein